MKERTVRFCVSLGLLLVRPDKRAPFSGWEENRESLAVLTLLYNRHDRELVYRHIKESGKERPADYRRTHIKAKALVIELVSVPLRD